MRLILGLIKGLIIGGGVGYGALQLFGINATWSHWITYGVVGALVGVLVGKPLWSVLADKDSTIVTVILKAVFGYGVGVLIYALVGKLWGGAPALSLEFLGEPGSYRLHDWQPVFGAFVGGLYGAFVEVDDAPAKLEGGDKTKQLKS